MKISQEKLANLKKLVNEDGAIAAVLSSCIKGPNDKLYLVGSVDTSSLAMNSKQNSREKKKIN